MPFAHPLSVALLECREGRVVRANEAFAALLGVAGPEDLCGRSPDAWLVDAGQGLPDWSAGEHAPGVARPVECAMRPEGGAPARRVRFQPVGRGLWELHDVTELRRLGAESREFGARLREVQQALLAERARGAEERAGVEELLTRVSHELRTPVTVVGGFLRLLRAEEAGPLTSEQTRFVDECQRSVRRLDAFVANLLVRGQPEAAPAPGAVQDTSLAETVESVAAFLKPLLEEGGHRLKLELAPQALRARFEPSRVEQVLVNLVGNAMAHGRPHGEITLVTRRLEAAGRQMVEVAVCDDGPGIPPAERERIFEPYARAGEASGAGGLGLGLAICKNLVEAQGGTIVAGAAPGGGARVAFTLPVREPLRVAASSRPAEARR